MFPTECTKLTEHGSDLAQNGIELSGNVGHNSTVGTKLAQHGAELVQHGVKMEPKFVPAIELLEYGFPVSSPSGDEPWGACASGAASSSIT